MSDVIELGSTEEFGTLNVAIEAIDRGQTLQGLLTLEHTPGARALPLARSYLAYCMAKERGQIRHAVGLCHEALAADPSHPAHYLNLGRVLLVAGDKQRAIATFWRGISRNSGPEHTSARNWPRSGRRREHDLIMDELRRLGIRKPPPFRALRRDHPINKYLGVFLSRIGLR
jgi:hypothetical protein